MLEQLLPPPIAAVERYNDEQPAELWREDERFLGLVDLVTPLECAENDESNKLVQDKGFAHEESFLESLRAKGFRITEIAQHLPAEEAARATLEALADGPDIIFQAAFLSPPFYGRADFLRRVEGRSRFGDWQYEVMDTKLARSVKAKFVIQLCFYSDLLAGAQGVAFALLAALDDLQHPAVRAHKPIHSRTNRNL